MSKQAGRMSQGANDFLAPYKPTIETGTDVGTGRAYNNGAISVTFTAAGPYAATSYTVTAVEDASKTASGASSPIVVENLASGTSYTFKVTATNSYGTSEASSATSAVTATTVPQAPSAPSGSSPSGASYDTVTWSAPANGGKAISNYHVEGNDGTAGDTSGTSINISQGGGQTQAYRVYATNANGNSDYSGYSSNVTTFSFTPFSVFGFSPFGVFGFSPFGVFGFSPFGVFGFSPFGVFGFSPGWRDSISIETKVLTTNGYVEAKNLNVGDKVLAVDLGENNDWLSWSTTEDLSNLPVVETTIVSLTPGVAQNFVFIDGDMFVNTHNILVKKDGVIKYLNVAQVDTTYQRYSHEHSGFVDILVVEAIDMEMEKLSINCEPYDNFFTEKSLAFDRPDTV
jgi:hypothetical protein